MALIYLGIGTNLGDKEKNLDQAINLLSEQVGKIISVSSFFYSEPWGFESDNDFLNAVVLLETKMQPLKVLLETQQVEQQMGRTVKSKDQQYADRIIDIDILLYDDLVVESDKLRIPHPLLQERDFVLCPLAEIAPDCIHPIQNKSIKMLWHEFQERK